MKFNVFLLLFIFTTSTQMTCACHFTTYISPDFFDAMQMFATRENAPEGEAPATICESGFDLTQAMASTFAEDGTLHQLTITTDLSKYTNKEALLKAVTSCIQTQTACGFASSHPKLYGWEVVSPTCNPSATKKDFAAWRRLLEPDQQAAIKKLEAFIKKIVRADFKEDVYSLATRSTTARSTTPRRSPRGK